MKIFNRINEYRFPDNIEQINTENGRYYTDGNEKYPSITTILSASSKSGIDKWRKRIGIDEADQQTTQAGNRGDAIHDLCEKYIANDQKYYEGHMPINIQTFKKLKPVLDTKIDNIVCQEQRMISKSLKCAGTVDLIAEFDQKLSVIDFKTSKKKKQMKYIKNYLTQASVYCICFYELFGIMIEQIVILIVNDTSPIPQVIIENPRKCIGYYPEFRKEYDKNVRRY